MTPRPISAATQARAQRALEAQRRERIVQHARLLPATADDTAALRFSVEDALNTFDFADCGRLVLVRRLHLHGLPPRPSPMAVSQRLEAAWRSVAASAWPASHPQAPQAQAVFFASRTEARLLWLRRTAQKEPTAAWFWPRAIPELPAAANAETVVSTVLQTLLLEAPRELLQALQRWPDSLLLGWAAALPVEVADALLGWLVRDGANLRAGDVLTPDVEAVPWLSLEAIPAQAVRHVARRMRVGSLVAGPSRSAWVLALWLNEAMGTSPTLAHVNAVMRAEAPGSGPAMEHGTEEAASRGAGQLGGPAQAVHAAPSMARAAPSAVPLSAATCSAASTAAPPARPDRVTSATARPIEAGLLPRRSPRAGQQPSRSIPWLTDAAATSCGGLLFLANVWTALGIERWLALHPQPVQSAFVNLLFLQSLRCVGAAGTDPQHAAFALDAQAQSLLATARFGGADPADDAATAARRWLVRARRVLRRRARLSLRELVQRPAWFSHSFTHIDVVMPLADADLRLRRTGLDSDPGWRTWLGRIVAFHFIDDADLPPWPWESTDG